MNTTIHWFRQDLRLEDNPALLRACQSGQVLPLYIVDDDSAGDYALGAASRWWLHHSLHALNQQLGGNLSLYRGRAETIFPQLIARFNVTGVYWNRCYEPWRIARDTRIKQALEAQGVHCESFNASLLWEPWTIKKADATPYKVFTPFYHKGCLRAPLPHAPLPRPQQAHWLSDDKAQPLAALNLLPRIGWDQSLLPHWQMGEAAAQQRLATFLATQFDDYQQGRDFPALDSVSRLSPHLHFGEISPRSLWQATQELPDDNNREHFRRELAWREFSYQLLYHNPELPSRNLQSKFDHFPWRHDARALAAWQQGKTGIPMVDAGMRELWQTGYMHNRVRMIVGSFLVKNLRLHWHHGERWFWDCLVDADLANNSASWQWIAGCGADAAPYFRIFNPVTQGQKFDANGDYIRRWIPEIADLPNKYLFAPWTATDEILAAANIAIGDTYPAPIVDIKQSRQQALAAFQSLKGRETGT